MPQMVNYREELHRDIAMSFNVHDHLKGLSVESLCNECIADSLPFAIGCINLTGNVNIGTIIRTACLYGAEKVFILGRRQFDARGLVGSDKYVDIEYVPCMNGTSLELNNDIILTAIENSGYTPVLVEQGGKPLGIFDWSSVCYDTSKPLLLFGNENRGIDPSLVDAICKSFDNTQIVSILQKGVLRSHNVAVSAGIVMHDMTMNMSWL